MKRCIALFFLCSCGLSKKTPLVELTPEQLDKVCKDLEGERTYICEEEGVFIQFTIGGDCVDRNSVLPEDCTATVRDLRDCDEARHALYEDNPCSTESPDVCALIDSCQLEVL